MKYEQYTIVPSERIYLETGDTCFILNRAALLDLVDDLVNEATDGNFHNRIYCALESLLPRGVVIEDFREED